VAAVVAGWFAFRARTSEAAAARTLELERRLATVKAGVYEPLIEGLRAVFDSVSDSAPMMRP